MTGGGRKEYAVSRHLRAPLVLLTFLAIVSQMLAADAEAEKRARAWMRPVVETGSEVFQYHVSSPNPKGRPIRSWLWIPPNAERVRGLIYAGDLMMEANFVVDPTIRKACEEQGIAVLFSNPHLPLALNKKDLSGGEAFVKALTALAEMSGYPEVATVPIMPLGHSAASPTVGKILAWNPDRCFGAVTYKGAHPIPTEGPTESLRGIPNIHIQDYVDEYKNRRETGSLGRLNVLQMRAKDTQLLMGIIEDCGSKHPAWCFRLTPLIAEYIRATAALRIGDDGTVKAVPVDAGYLLDKDFHKPRFPMAPAAEFKGDPKEALWYPSRQMAQMMSDYNAVQLGKEAQYVAFLDNAANPIPEKAAPPLKWVAPDVFEVKATFLDKASNPALPQVPVTHADGPILFAPHGRTLQLVGPGRFQLYYHPQAVRWYRISAYARSDAGHRFEEVLTDIHIGSPAGGKPQTIEFPEIGTVKRKAFPVALNARSSADLPVRYCVEYGPAVVKDGKLELSEVPKKAKFPIEILVTAYQYGSHAEPHIQQAERISRSITVE